MAVSARVAVTVPYPVLYSFRRCPYAMRARLTLAASGTKCELREVVLAQKPQALVQTLDIMLWALRRHDPQHWLPTSTLELDSALALITQCDGDFKFHLDRYKYPNRYALPDGLADRSLGAQFLQTLNTRLQAQAFLQDDHFGLADAAIAPFVRQFARTDLAWFASQPWSALQQWLAAFEASDAYHGVMGKFPAWVQGQAPVVFPA